ncbi:MAG: DMT family transporter [Pseudomonadota bacterium]
MSAPQTPQDGRPRPNPFTGILLKVLSVAVIMGMTSSVKALDGAIPAGEMVFFRSLFALPPIFVWLLARGGLPGALATRNPAGHAWRSVAGVAAMSLMFVGIGLLPLTEVVAITYAAPLFITLFAALILGERIRLYRMSAVGIGFLGVSLVMYPRLTALTDAEASLAEGLGALAALGAAVMMGIAQTFVRGLSKTETTAAIVFWFTLASTILTALTLPFAWVTPDVTQFALLVAAGVSGGVAQILLTAAYRYAEAGVIAPFEYVSMIMAVAIGFFVFGEVPTLVVLGGAALVTTGGILIIWRERQLGRDRDRSRRARGSALG